MPTINELNNEKTGRIETIRNAFAPYVSNLAAKDFVAIFHFEFDKLVGETDLDGAFKQAAKLRDILKNERAREAEILQDQDASLDVLYFNAVHDALILLATYWPSNNRESGLPEDPFSLEDLTDETVVFPTSEGILYEWASIIKHFTLEQFTTPDKDGNKAYLLQSKTGEQRFVGPSREELSQRDLHSIVRKGVAIPEVPNPGPEVQAPAVPAGNPVADANAAGAVAALVDGAVAGVAAAVPNPEDNSHRTLREYLSDLTYIAFNRGDELSLRVSRFFKPKTAAQWGMFLFAMAGSAVLGALVLQASILGLMAGALAPSVIVIISYTGVAAYAVSVAGAILRGEPTPRAVLKGMISSAFAALAALVVVGLLTFGAPYILGFLASASIITVAAQATVMASLAIIQMAVPIVMAVIAAIREFRVADGMRDFYMNVVASLFAVPGIVLGAVGGTLGAIGGFFGRLLFGTNPPPVIVAAAGPDPVNPVNPANPPVAANDNNPPQPDNVFNNDQNNNPNPANAHLGGGSHADIINGLGVNGFDNVFYAPITANEENELKAALGNEAWQEAVEANRRLLEANGHVANAQQPLPVNQAALAFDIHNVVRAAIAANRAPLAANVAMESDDNSSDYNSDNSSDYSSSDDEMHAPHHNPAPDNDVAASHNRVNDLNELPFNEVDSDVMERQNDLSHLPMFGRW